jgi:metal-responsive CopG/Arc/MetJ family transcriptional regulator
MAKEKRKILGFSVPPQMAEEFEALCDAENRTKSELFREMFRAYKYLRSQGTPTNSVFLVFLKEARKKGKCSPGVYKR